MRFTSILFAATAVLAAVNEPCYGGNGQQGVCIDAGACTSAGGTTITGACPWDAANIKCCSKATCKGAGSACGWTSDCGGTSTAGLCPGPSQMQCCSKTPPVFGGYAAPSIPAVGACKASAVAGARTLVNAFPGRVREIFCTRACTCGSGSDHCCGKAIDYMIADGGGRATLSGRSIAEWAMNNRGSLNLKYIIWGQKIWNPSQDGVKAWTSWRTMEDRGDLTQNHWDHVHISFN